MEQAGDGMGVWLVTAQSATVVTPGNPALGPAPAGEAGPAATGVPAGGTPAPGGAQPSPFGGMGFLLILVGFMVFMIMTSVMSQRKEKKRRQQLLESLGKGDRVQTIGGVIGTIQEMRDDEVVLKVDEQSNTRIRFARVAIQQVLKSGGGGGSGGEMSVEVKAKSPAKV